MESKANLAGLPTHPMLVVIPLGLFATSLVFDLIRVFSENGVWSLISEYMIGAGVIGALLAVAFGTMDWIAVPRSTMRDGANIVVTGMFAASALLRLSTPADPPAAALMLSALAVLLALGTRWMGRVTLDAPVVRQHRPNLSSARSLSGHPTLSR